MTNQQLDPAERRILFVTCFGHSISHFNMLAFPALVLPLTWRLSLTVPQVLELSFWMYLLFGLTALPWGLITDRTGPRRMLLIFFAGAGICGLAAASSVNNPLHLAMSLAGIGLFSGIYHPAGLGLVSKSIRRVSLAMGYNGMFGNLGLAAGPLLTGVMNWLGGPVAAFVFLAAVNLMGAVLMFFMPMDTQSAVQKAQANETNGPNRWLPFVVLLCAMMAGGVGYRGSSVILPTMLELRGKDIYDFIVGVWPGTPSANLVATTLTSGVYLLGVLAQWIGGRVGERYELRRSYLLFHAISVPAAMLAGMFTGLPMLMFIAFYLFFLLGMQPIENTLVGKLSPASFRHSAFGLKFVFTFGVASSAVWLVAQVEQTHGLGSVFPVLGVASCVVVSAILVLMWVTRNQKL